MQYTTLKEGQQNGVQVDYTLLEKQDITLFKGMKLLKKNR